jgi:hypothetical protein
MVQQPGEIKIFGPFKTGNRENSIVTGMMRLTLNPVTVFLRTGGIHAGTAPPCISRSHTICSRSQLSGYFTSIVQHSTKEYCRIQNADVISWIDGI